MNRLCLCLNGASLRESLALLKAEPYFQPHWDCAELRADFFLPGPHLPDSPDSPGLALQNALRELEEHQGPLPQMLLTLRKTKDGGYWSDAATAKETAPLLFALLEALARKSATAPYLDLDEQSLQPGRTREAYQNVLELLYAKGREKGGKLIASIHEFGPMPPEGELFERLQALAALPGTPILKLAVEISSTAEQLRFFALAQRIQEAFPNPHILVAMHRALGGYGEPSRILSAHLGNLWTYCSPSPSKETQGRETQGKETKGAGRTPVAPGQLSAQELCESYHYRRLTTQTRIFGIVGRPVAHSRSPQIHNPYYQEQHWDAVYLRFLCDDPVAFLQLAEYLPIRGLSCTIPHKEILAAHLSQAGHLSDAAQTIGACNTLYRVSPESGQGSGQAKGPWSGDNTDAWGFLAPLRERGFLLEGRRAAVIGAGGAARAVLYALLSEGVDCLLLNRSAARAHKLAAYFSRFALRGRIVQAAGLDEGRTIPPAPEINLIVQTSSVGMAHSSTEGQDPIPAYRFHPGQFVYDLIYEPRETPVLLRAAQEGAECLGGWAMLQAQAQKQIQHFSTCLTV